MIRLESELTDTFNSSTTSTKESSSKFASRSAGRWTKEEHQKFVEGLRKFGKNWKQVEEFVGTRNGAQIRSHAQKFFNRLEREYNVKLNNGKAPVGKKKGKDMERKVSDASISTYYSSLENLSDDCKSEDTIKEEPTKLDVVMEVEEKSQKADEIDTPLLNKPLISSDDMKDLIKDVLIICQKQTECVQIASPVNAAMMSYSFFDIMSKIKTAQSQGLTIQVPKLSDLVAMPKEQRQYITIPTVSNQQNISCSFRIFPKNGLDQNLTKKLKPLRKGQMLDDVIVKKLRLE